MNVPEPAASQVSLPSGFGGADFVPVRVGRDESARARELLDADGAVILCGWPAEPDSTVQAAAALLGTRLRSMEQLRERRTDSGDELPLHTDGANKVVDIHGRRVHLHGHDVDYVIIQSVTPAPAGGETFVIDGYRLVKRIRQADPDLYRFLTSVDVDLDSAVGRADLSSVPPRVSHLVEWTRGGRMVVRATHWAQPCLRFQGWEEHQSRLEQYSNLLRELGARASHTLTEEGELVVLDNYRCSHGVRAHEGPRATNVLSCTSDEAW